MLDKYLNDYEQDETRLYPKTTFRRALIYTLFDSIFIGLKVGIIFGILMAFINLFAVKFLTEFGSNICPLFK